MSRCKLSLRQQLLVFRCAVQFTLVPPRAYRATVGGERACNSHSANVDGEILIVTKNSTNVQHTGKYRHVCSWFHGDLLSR